MGGAKAQQLIQPLASRPQGKPGRGAAATPYQHSNPFRRMDSAIGRRHLPHEIPLDVAIGPEYEVFFITICCQPRGRNQLATRETWQTIDESISHRERLGDLRARLVLAMPDHLHGLIAFPGSKSMTRVMADFKAWVAKSAGVGWQRDFFEHRLRGQESAAEKANYIRHNPVRAGLVCRPEDWPYQR